jgi:hypothetical protein
MNELYENWYAYARNCTNAQLRNVFTTEQERLEYCPDDEVRADTMQAVSACRVVAAERGISL